MQYNAAELLLPTVSGFMIVFMVQYLQLAAIVPVGVGAEWLP